jgi:hypothetical protein
VPSFSGGAEIDCGLFWRLACSLPAVCHPAPAGLFSFSFSLGATGVGVEDCAGLAAGGAARVWAGGVEVLGATTGTAGLGVVVAGPTAAAARLAQLNGFEGAAGWAGAGGGVGLVED